MPLPIGSSPSSSTARMPNRMDEACRAGNSNGGDIVDLAGPGVGVRVIHCGELVRFQD
jgi:hypothetical protein